MIINRSSSLVQALSSLRALLREPERETRKRRSDNLFDNLYSQLSNFHTCDARLLCDLNRPRKDPYQGPRHVQRRKADDLPRYSGYRLRDWFGDKASLEKRCQKGARGRLTRIRAPWGRNLRVGAMPLLAAAVGASTLCVLILASTVMIKKITRFPREEVLAQDKTT